MKIVNTLSHVLAGAGILLVVYAFLGRFIGGPSVFGYLIPGGIKASSAMLGANTLLLLAILANFYKKN